MPAGATEAAWLGLFTALINGRLSWWHKRSWQQQKPQTVANPSSSHYHRCMRGAILPFLPDLSLWRFRGGWTKIWNRRRPYVCKHLALCEYPAANQLCWDACAQIGFVTCCHFPCCWSHHITGATVCVAFWHWNSITVFALHYWKTMDINKNRQHVAAISPCERWQHQLESAQSQYVLGKRLRAMPAT